MHGTEGKVYDRFSFTWVTPEELEERREIRARNSARMRGANTFPCPYVIGDGQGGIHGLQSMVDGRVYDSKSNMRRHYRETGHVELGNDVKRAADTYMPHKRPKSVAEREARTQGVYNSVERAISQSNLTKRRQDETPNF